MSNYNELNNIETPKNIPKKNYIARRSCGGGVILNSFAIISTISCTLCTIYIIMMYHDIKSLVTDFNSINSLVNGINMTKMTTGLLSLENCILNKLSICS